MNYLAIDVGGTFTKYAIITKECEMIEKGKFHTKLDTVEELLDSLVETYNRLKNKYEIAGIALSMAGIIDSENGFMHTGGNLFCVHDLSIVEILEERCQVPVTVENDAKCAAYAEIWTGALSDVNDAVVMVCGTGVGGAVIHNKKVLKGTHFMAGEFSYVLTDSIPDYSMDYCLAGNTGIRNMMDYVAQETGIEARKLDGIKVFDMANAGDEKALAGIKRYVKNLAIQIHNYHYILDPERFAIGGGVSVQPLFLKLIQEEVAKINAIFPWDLPLPEIVTCKYFNDANLIGAVYVHMQMKGESQ